MAPRSKKKSSRLETLGSVALDALKLAVPVSKAIPVVGNILEGSLEVALHIIEVKDVSSSNKTWHFIHRSLV
jgi:hypothetical protein